MRRWMMVVMAMLCAAGACAGDCQEFAYRSAAASVAGVERVIIIGGAPFLHVAGRAGAARIRADGKACAAIEELLVGIRLSASRSGKVVTIQASVPKQKATLFAAEPHLDFTVTVPSGVDVEVVDLSGEVRVQRVRNVIVDQHAGPVSVSDLAGDFTVRKGSGAVDYERVKGLVTIAR